MKKNRRSIICKSVAALSLSVMLLGLGKQTSQALRLNPFKLLSSGGFNLGFKLKLYRGNYKNTNSQIATDAGNGVQLNKVKPIK